MAHVNTKDRRPGLSSIGKTDYEARCKAWLKAKFEYERNTAIWLEKERAYRRQVERQMDIAWAARNKKQHS